MTTIIADFPAYTIIDAGPREFQPGDVIAVPYQSARYGTLFSFYTLGSVEAYAARYNEDPAEAVEQAKERGEKLYWANANGTMLTAEKRAKEIVPGFEIGGEINFAGQIFRIERAPNNNIDLVLI